MSQVRTVCRWETRKCFLFFLNRHEPTSAESHLIYRLIGWRGDRWRRSTGALQPIWFFFLFFFGVEGGGRPPAPPSEDDMIYLFPSPGCVPPHFSRVSASAKLEEIGDWSIECVCVCVCVSVPWVCYGVCVCVCIGVAPAPRRLLGWKLDRGRSRRTKKKGKNTNKKIK